MGHALAVKRRKAQYLTALGGASFNKLAVGFRSWYGFGKTARRRLNLCNFCAVEAPSKKLFE